MIGNIRVTNSGAIPTNPTQKNVASLTFSENNTITADDLKKFEDANTQVGERNLSELLSGTAQREAVYALIGGIANSSGGKVIATFNNGAKMYGDLYAASSNGSKIKVTFQGNTGTPTSGKTRYIFEGGMLAINGDNEMIVKAGDIFLDSVTFGNFGMRGENNGYNQLTFGNTTPTLAPNNGTNQPATAGTASNVTALSITAVTSSNNSTYKTGNFIYFVNGAATANTMNVRGSIRSDSGANIIQTLGQSQTGSNKTKLNLTVDEAISTTVNKKATDYNNSYNYNKIIIDGSITAGKTGLNKNGVTSGATLGIVNFGGANNLIVLGDTSTAKALDYNTPTNNLSTIGVSAGTTYNAARSLTTTRIYAAKDAQTKNTIVIDGDLALIYKQENLEAKPARNGVIFGDILATAGATNDITVAGIIKGDAVGGGGTIDANTMLVISDSGSTNKITINNQNSQSAITLGKFFSSGGSNTLAVTNNVSTTIASVIATDKKMESKNPDTGGANELFFKNGIVTINDIQTQGIGINKIAITASSATATGTLNFSEAGGTNTIYFGENTNGDTVAGQKVSGIRLSVNDNGQKNTKIEYSLTINSSKKLDLIFKENSYFNGSIGGTSNSTIYTSNISYTLKKDAIFVGNINKKDNLSGSNSSITNGTLTLGDGAKFVLDFKNSTAKQDGNIMEFGKLTLNQSTSADTNYKLATESMNGTVVDIATDGISNVSETATHRTGTTARTLKVANLVVNGSGGNAPLFRLYTDGVGSSDNIVINKTVETNTAVEAQVFLSSKLLNHDFGADTTKTVIFTEMKTNGTSNLSLGDKTKTATTGFTSYSLGITKGTQDNNTIWYLGNIQDKQVNTEAVEYTTSAMGINYGIFVQNINSLNKRMGELRNNDDTQGVWARVFTGKQTSTMDLIPSDSTYVTVQGGYDYGFGVTGGTNYLGVALSYGYTSSETDRSTNAIASITGYSSKSSNIEVAVYNSYIQDEGWFSDTIAKFGYIMSDFDIYEQSSTQKQSLSNFALSLGQEVGYRFALGSEKNWFIDPQVELVAGYINSTDLSQAQGGQILDGKLDSVFLFRTRVGSDFGYSLKKDKNQYDFRLGLSYEYDVANADAFFDIASANMSKVFSNAVDNDGRVVLNLGTNMKFGENMRLYFDFEKSFAGKITTDYQVNLGFRYGFGEKLVKVVEEVNTQEKAPLKIENTQTQEQPQNQVQ